MPRYARPKIGSTISQSASGGALFALLVARLPAAKIEDAKAATPKPLHNLWPS